jgi:hypothetical protein
MRPGMAAVRLLLDRHLLRSGVGRTGHCASRHAPRHGCDANLFALLRRRHTPASLRSVLSPYANSSRLIVLSHVRLGKLDIAKENSARAFPFSNMG